MIAKTTAIGLILAALSPVLLVASPTDEAQSLSPGAYPPPEVEEGQLALVHARPNIANHNELSSFIDGIVRTHMRAYHIPGVTVAIIKDDRSILEKGYGEAGNGEDVRADKTMFRLGEVSEIFTWITMMQLEESGYLSLDDPVNTRLPQNLLMPVHATGPLLIHHLMEHKTGLDTIQPTLFGTTNTSNIQSPEDALAHIRPRQIRAAGLYAVPSPYGAALAGAIITNVTGRNFPGYVEDNIFTPLGMASSSFREPMNPDLAEIHGLPQPLPDTLAPALSSGYHFENSALVERPFSYYSAMAPALSLSSTAHDMGRFMRAALNSGHLEDTRILRPETMKRMYGSLSRTADLRLPTIRHGFLDYILPGGKRGIGHDGAIPGFTSNLVMVPDLDLGIFIATNSDQGKALVNALPALLVAQFFPEDTKEQTAHLPPEQMRVDTSVEGIYLDLDRPVTSRTALPAALGARYCVQQNKDGLLRVAGPHKTTQYREIAPGIYGAIRGDHIGPSRIGFLKSKDGAATHMTAPSGKTTMELTGFFNRPIWLFLIASAVALAALSLIARYWHQRHQPRPVSLLLRLTDLVTPILALVWLVSCGLLFAVFAFHATHSIAITNTVIPVLTAINTLALLLTGLAVAGLWMTWRGDSKWTIARYIHHMVAITLMVWIFFPLFHWNLVGL